MRIRTLAATAGIGALLVLTGCVGGDPLPTLPPEPTSAPIFASEEEALAAAEEAYAAYSEVSAQISMDGGADAQRIAQYVTDEQLASELATAEYYESNGLRASAPPTTSLFTLQQYSELQGMVEVVVYVCVDVTDVAVLNESGADVTPTDREPVVALEVTLIGEGSRDLLIASTEVWPGTSFC